jgi:hypothetical protein
MNKNLGLSELGTKDRLAAVEALRDRLGRIAKELAIEARTERMGQTALEREAADWVAEAIEACDGSVIGAWHVMHTEQENDESETAPAFWAFVEAMLDAKLAGQS